MIPVFSNLNVPVDPLFWLGLSLLLVAVSLTVVLLVALPTLWELARAARSAEKLFDTLSRELPPTLEAIRLTGLEITDLTEDMSQGVQSAGRVVQQLDQNMSSARKQAKQAQVATRSLFAGIKTAWKTFNRPMPRRRFADSPASKSTFDVQDYSQTLHPSDREPYEDYEEAYLEESDVDNPDSSRPTALPADLHKRYTDRDVPRVKPLLRDYRNSD